MSSDIVPLRVTITAPNPDCDGRNPELLVLSGHNSLPDAYLKKAVIRDVYGREFPGNLTQKFGSNDWRISFSGLPTNQWLVAYVEFQNPGSDDIAAAIRSLRCQEKATGLSPLSEPRKIFSKAKKPIPKKGKAKKKKK